MDNKQLKKNMENFLGKKCMIVGDHLRKDEMGVTDRVEIINSTPTMIVKLDNGEETNVVSNDNIMFMEELF